MKEHWSTMIGPGSLLRKVARRSQNDFLFIPRNRTVLARVGGQPSQFLPFLIPKSRAKHCYIQVWLF